MKKSVFFVLIVLIISVSFVSASSFSDWWNDLFGKDVRLNPETYIISIIAQPSTGALTLASCGNKAPKINVRSDKGENFGSFEFNFNSQEQTITKTLSPTVSGTNYFIFTFVNDCCLNWNGQICAGGDLNLNIKKIIINGREKIIDKIFYSSNDEFALYKTLGKTVSITSSELITTDKCSQGQVVIKCTASDTTISLFSYTDIPDSHINSQNPYKVEYSGNQMTTYSYYIIPANTVGTFKAGCYLDTSASNSDISDAGIYGAKSTMNPGIKEYTLNSCMTRNCEDITDQTNDISVKGLCVDYPNSVTTNHPDVCDTAPEIVEKKLWQPNCNSATKTCDATFTNCPSGTSCDDGKCVSQGTTPQTYCFDTDFATNNGKDYNTAGTCYGYVNSQRVAQPDGCDASGKLWEKFCNQDALTCGYEIHSCESEGKVCRDGKCVSSGGQPPCTDECNLGEARCHDRYTINICGDNNGDGCVEWYDQRCLDGCVNGACVGGVYNSISILSPTNNQEISCREGQECNLQVRWRIDKNPNFLYYFIIQKLDENNQPGDPYYWVFDPTTVIDEGNNEYSYQLNLNDDYTGPNNNLRTLKSIGYGKFRIALRARDFGFDVYSEPVTFTKIQGTTQQQNIIARAVQKVVEAIKDLFS